MPRTLHHTAQGIEDGLGGEVLGGDQVNEVLLAVFLLELVSAGCPVGCPESHMTYLLEDVEDGRVGVLQRGSQEL